MKNIGILGGMAPDSTVEYYRILISLTKKRGWGKKYPEIIIFSLNFKKFYEHLSARNNPKVISILSKRIDALERAGADFALLASNTPHIFFDEIDKNSQIPLLSIASATAEEAKRRDYKKVGLIGTNYTMNGNFYEKEFEKKSISLKTPNENEKKYVHNKIFKEIAEGKFIEETRKKLVQIVKRMKKKEEIDAVVLGCTELPLFLKKENLNLPILNTTKIHASAALNRATKT
ncbi:hypothetical protein AKJ51_02930 [candidate division MSBL1 archaeon SCGC-AAA382A20]|uniref:Aspartate racemase n=1 Tax=candidate division MSBL1 archaeon SCGC-AAA382A20 TaxID=1698280 RepID=A0A133VK03_9EURY|nr:hypothetical protein AKJ51_02930 [candidate division MSBL1 archaeon SCGC-AAA382A20]